MSYADLVRHHLSLWITFLLTVIKPRSRGTFVELLCGCMISPEGWVTRAIGAITRSKHWTTYYKLIERGSIRTLALAQATLLLAIKIQTDVEEPKGFTKTVTLVIDDFITMRQSEKAPASIIHHDHAKRNNRPTYVLSQNWVVLGISMWNHAFSILCRLVPAQGNRNKLKIAESLLRGLAFVLRGYHVRVLFDSWFMRARLVLPLLARKMSVIAQARIDTALFLEPQEVKTHARGRPRIYGQKLTREDVDALTATEMTLNLYGKEQKVRLRSIVAKVRFLKGLKVCAVWSEFFDANKGAWGKRHLLLATETNLVAEVILLLYSKRWGIESLIHNLKRWWGINNLWQQSRRVLECWMQIRVTAWTLVQLLVHVVEHFPMMAVAPWRIGQPMTGGLVAQWMRMEFTGLQFSDGFDRKSQKFTFPVERGDPRLRFR